jgi:hypothetical protein
MLTARTLHVDVEDADLARLGDRRHRCLLQCACIHNLAFVYMCAVIDAAEAGVAIHP